jgi:mRNA interferase MazF
MKRGEIWLVGYGAAPGGKIRKKRPVVVISNDASNNALNRVQVIPLTARTERLYPGEAVIHLEGMESKTMADQLTTMNKERLFNCVGFISPEDMHKIEESIKLQLEIP